MNKTVKRTKMQFAGFVVALAVLLPLLSACPDPVAAKAATYAIIISSSVNGRVSAGKEKAGAGEIITLTVRPDSGYELASIRISGASANAGDVPLDGSGSIRTFTMPAEDVTVYASFMLRTLIETPIERPVEEPAVQYGIDIMQTDNGSIECGQSSAAAGAAVSLTLLPEDEHYRYRDGTLTITPDVELTEMGESMWTFIMPEEAVSISAEFEEIPAHTITVSTGSENGDFDIDYEGEVREGTIVTITALPDPGYKVAGGEPFVTPADAISFTRVEDQAAWTFTMADTDLEIGVAFDELGLLEIYKGGARKGITVGALTDEASTKLYRDSIDMESEEPGHSGNRRAIKITTALNANGNAAQQSFGLFSDTEIDLATASALSFWAKANKASKIRFAGFGDADPDKRVVYIGENYNHDIPVTAEWKHYIVPVPAAGSGLKITRAFLFNATISKESYICIDDIEFIESGVRVSGISIPDVNEAPYYGATAAIKMLKGANIAIGYACDDGIIATLQYRSVTGALKYNLAEWLTPFININGNVAFSDGIVYPGANSSAFDLTVNMDGTVSNPMAVTMIDGLLLDDFEDYENMNKLGITAAPGDDRGYLWHANGSGSTVVTRDYITSAHNEIHHGRAAGSWRPSSASTDVKKLRGGRNFEAKDACGCTTLTFWIKVTTGGNINIQRNTAFTFELRNDGSLTKNNDGVFYTRQFTYNPDNDDGWQEIRIPLSDYVDAGLDASAITGYAFGVVDNQGVSLRIMLDDIALIGR